MFSVCYVAILDPPIEIKNMKTKGKTLVYMCINNATVKGV